MTVTLRFALLTLAILILLALLLCAQARGSTFVTSATDRVEVAAAQCSSYLVNDLRRGQTVVIGAGRINAPPGGFKIPSGVRLAGAWPGRNRITGGTIIIPASENDDAFVLCGEDDPPGNVRLEQLIVRGNDKPGTGRGFVLDVPGPGIPAHIELVRCMAWGVGQDGFFIRTKGSSVDGVLMEGNSSCRNRRHGYYLERVAWGLLKNSIANANYGSGVVLESSDLTRLEDVFADGNASPQMLVSNTLDLQITGGAAERFYSGVGLEVRGGRHVQVSGVSFLSGSPRGFLQGTSIRGVDTDSMVVGRNFHRKVQAISSWTNSRGYSVAAQSRTSW